MKNGKLRPTKRKNMFFDEKLSDQIEKYGFGLLTGNGKYHFVAALSETDSIVQLCCVSRPMNTRSLPKNKFVWFDDEDRAAHKFQKNKKACHKCLRTLETIQFAKAREENFA